MKSISSSYRGFLLLPVVVSLLLLFAAASISLQRAMRLKMITRDSERVNHLGSDDLQLQRSAMTQLAQELVDTIHYRSPQDRDSLFLQSSEKSWTLEGHIFGDLSALLQIHPWHPVESPYTDVSLPTHLQGTTRNSPRLLARKIILPYERRGKWEDRLRPETGEQQSSDLRQLTIYEIPTQTAAFGRKIKIDHSQVGGSVITRDLELGSTATVEGRVMIWHKIQMSAGARVSGVNITQPIDTFASSQLARDLETGMLSGGSRLSRGDFSIIRSNEWATWIDLGNRQINSHGICSLLLPASSPSPWDAYTLPYYACETRLFATWESDATVQVRILKNSVDTLEDRLALPTQEIEFSLQRNAAGQAGVSYWQATTGERLLIIDMAQFGGQTLYVSFADMSGSHLAHSLYVTLRNAHDMSHLGGFSLVTPNRLLLQGEININHPIPFSVFASELCYGYGHLASQVDLDGQLGSMADGTSLNLSHFRTTGAAAAQMIASRFTDILQSNQLPPITLKSWLITAENPE